MERKIDAFRKRQIRTHEAAKMNEVKIKLCDAIMKVASRWGENQLYLAFRAETTQATISNIYNYRIEALSYRQLIFILARMKPDFEILISV